MKSKIWSRLRKLNMSLFLESTSQWPSFVWRWSQVVRNVHWWSLKSLTHMKSEIWSWSQDLKSHSLRASKSGGNRKNRFSWNFAHFWFLSRDERKCIYFLIFHFRFHGNHDFLFLALFSYFSSWKWCILELPYQRGHIRNVFGYAIL